MVSNKDLLAKAQEYSANNVDLYELLQIDTNTTEESDIRRAWRKQSLKYHPDKLGDAFDAEKWELIETARDILLDLAARAAYDNGRKAVLLRKAERERVHGQRKRMIDELEAAEEAAKQKRQAEEDKARELERERARLAEEGRRRMEEENERFKRENLEAQERQRRERIERDGDGDEYDEKLADLQRQIDEKRRLKAERKAARKKGGEAPEKSSDTATAAPASYSRPPLDWGNLMARCREADQLKAAKKATAV
ncbi:hypothetical protein CSOJ01_00431 [Colletotrichum sojae]|uniref:J domain-containing protein n=1 Tax=Colletotrichum sojae TaxID=2175907 RepID=A0A8H6N687_9PEZI|nr:hypothetical protein CSOJ01_00431 [Colletotrichum sojae]